jgi:hypothetical protein
VVATVLAAAFFASTVVLATVAVRLEHDKDEAATGGRPAEVAEVASRFVEAVLDYDYRNPDASRDAVLALAADPFAEQYQAAIPQLQQGFETAQSVSDGTVKQVYLADLGDDGSATAVVEYDRVIHGTSGDRNETNRYLRLGLVQLGSGWRVNDVVDLNLAFANPTATSTPAGSTTVTTG